MRTICIEVTFSRNGKEHSRKYYNGNDQAKHMFDHLCESEDLDYVSIEALVGDIKDGRFTPTHSLEKQIYNPSIMENKDRS